MDRVRAEVAAAPGSVAGPSATPSTGGELVAPVPPGAPAPPDRHPKLGAPTGIWTYLDEAGDVHGRIMRFDLPDGAKEFRPQTLRRRAGKLEWAWLAAPDPRPLYGLEQLARKPSALVLIVEGEKSRDAAAKLFPDLAVVTFQGGAKATGKADLTPLRGRHVVAWPDADEPGRRAAQDIVKRLGAAGAASASVVGLPAFLPDKWDLADPFPTAFGLAEARAAIEAARVAGSPALIGWPFGYRMETDGLYFDQPVKDGGLIPQRLSAPFEVLAEGRTKDGSSWSVILRFSDRDGRVKTIPVSRQRLATGGAEVRGELAGEGLVISPARGKAERFSAALGEVRCDNRETLVSTTGWCGPNLFVLPDRAVGLGEAVRYIGQAGALKYGREGTLAGWKSEIAAFAVGNEQLMFAISLALSGPLLRPLEIDGGGVHYLGDSSVGKTTLGMAAGSVWGGSEGTLGFAQTWRATANALEGIAIGHNDTLLVLDELKAISAEEAGAAAYILSAGQSKGRSQTSGELRKRSEWRVVILSTGEISLADHMMSGRKGERVAVGQEMRLLHLQADAGSNMGIWQTLHGVEGPAQLSETIGVASRRHYGHAGMAFVERFLTDRPRAIADAQAFMSGFLEAASEIGDTGQVHRAAVRFASIAAAGELACTFGLVPWQAGDASKAALSRFRAWAQAFGRDAPREKQVILGCLKAVIQSKQSMFAAWGEDEIEGESLPSAHGRGGEARSLVTYGYRRVRGTVVDYLFHTSGWAEVFKGLNVAAAAATVHGAGFLDIDVSQGRLQKVVARRDGVRARFYVVKSSILEADLGD